MSIRPYGDTLNDGKVQLSFTLPMDAGAHGIACAKELARQMGLPNPEVAHCEQMGEGFSFYVVYGMVPFSVNPEQVEVHQVETQAMTMAQVEAFIRERLGREIVFVGASTGTDAHTVGIDAIMNMKGYNHRFGLERYQMFNAINMGAQVPSEELLARARKEKADAILVSQVVTQKNIHIKNLTRLIELAEAERLRDKMLFICGGPRISHELAIELGYDAGFGTGSYSTDVASFIAITLAARAVKA